MQILLKILKYFFVTLGVIFFLIILFLIYFFTADPLGLRPLIQSFQDTNIEVDGNFTVTEDGAEVIGEGTVSVDKHPALNETQEKTLETIGIDPASVPTSITPEMESCFVEKLGQQRVDEIIAGSEPTIFEALTAKDCL